MNSHPRIRPHARTGSPASRRAGRWVGLASLAAAGILAAMSVPVVAQASAPTKTSFSFSGSLTGTLSGANSPCADLGGSGAQFSFYGMKLKGLSDKQWSVNINNLGHNKKGGTFTKFGGIVGNGVSIVVDGTNGKTAYYWASKSGKLTITPTSGTLKVLLVPYTSFVGKPGKGNVTISGSWGCTH
jgi:hypothetical protein